MPGALVLADDEAVTSTLALLLERSGSQTLVARDGLEALQVVRERQPELVILDVRMPRLNGRTVCRLREAHDWTPATIRSNVAASVSRLIGRAGAPASAWRDSRSGPGRRSQPAQAGQSARRARP
jgi:CheY-like chemotaxis protein